MSIVALSKVSMVGHTSDKERILIDLQELGCLQLIPLIPAGDVTADRKPSAEVREALVFLLSCPNRRPQVKSSSRFDAIAVEHRALEVKHLLQDLQDEHDFLSKRISDLKPWGDFTFLPLDQMNGRRFWFYVVPHNQMQDVEATGLRWEIVKRDNRFCYVVVISEKEPGGMPVERTHTGSQLRHKLEERLEEVEQEIEDLQAERSSLSRWCMLFARSLDHLEDLATRSQAASQTYDQDSLFGLQAWAPKDRITQLRHYTSAHGMVLEIREPEPTETPPTMLHNPPAFSGGEDLVNFYMTPGYFTWDPSSVVFISFSFFFAMILCDAGYSMVLGLILLLIWHRLGNTENRRRMRTIFTSLVAASIIYGVLAGSYFGVTPPSGSFLDKLHVLDMTDTTTMMTVSIVIGVIHIALGNIMDSYRMGWRAEALPPMGWAFMVVGGLLLAGGLTRDIPALTHLATFIMIGGALLVFLFSGVGSRPLMRILKGLLAFTNITKAFGDVLSYLRLFALGLASTSLAQAFNGLAMDARGAARGPGLLLALLVLLIGHGLNFGLAIISAVVHGLRLNLIEFFNWGIKEEGNLYRVFKRKESVPWTLSS